MNQEQKKAMISLKTAKGQIEGIMKMMDDERYCIDISNQIIAVQGHLKKANNLILKQHLLHCVKDAVTKEEGREKLDELIDIIEKLIQR